MLNFSVGLATSEGDTSYAKAVDGHMGQELTDCANSDRSPSRLVWLTIDLGHLYSVSNVKMLSRDNYGKESEIYVGKSAIHTNGSIDPIKDHKCPSSSTNPNILTGFSCSSIHWVQYVTIRRHVATGTGTKNDYYLQVCEVEVYYNENEDDGVIIKNLTSFPITTVSEIAMCGSSKGDFGPTWKFPNGTNVSTHNSAKIQQKNYNKPGQKKLILNSPNFIVQNGDYKCEYIANDAVKAITVNIVFAIGCQLGSWSTCSPSCGRGKQTRIITVNGGSNCLSLKSSKDCWTAVCGRIDMKNAVATHGPFSRLSASQAIDGNISSCATTLASTSPWLRVDLKTAYLITSVEASFWDRQGNGAVVRVGSNLTNDGNVNPQCGQPISNSASGTWTKTVCSPPLWGRYINVRKTSETGSYLGVCELRANYKLDVSIFYNDSSVENGAIYAYAGQELPFPVLCGVNPDPTNFNSWLSIKWRYFGDDSLIPTFSSDTDVGHSKVRNLTSLHIKKVPSRDEKYSCHFNSIGHTKTTLVFNLHINVNCTWKEWSVCSGSCGVKTRHRTPNNSVRKHQGKKCNGSSIEACNSTNVPCAPNPVLSKVIIKEGQQATLECEVAQQNGLLMPIIKFEWFKDGMNVTTLSSSSAPLTNGKYRGSLTFSSVKISDATSSYTCKARGKYGLSAPSAEMTLDVTYAPYNINITADSETFVKGRRLHLKCSAKANPPPQYLWQKNGAQLPRQSSQLFFLSLNYSDNGTYTCTVSNSLGSSASSKFLLIVDGPPEECTILSGKSPIGSDVALTVQCLIDGNAPVTNYRVFYRVPGLETWSSKVVTKVLPPIEVSDLIPFKKYEFKVSAGNEHGYGPNSSTIKVQTVEGEPGPPENVNAVSLDSYSIAVSWSPPINSRGIISKYNVYYRSSSRVKRETAVHKNITSVSGANTTANLIGLFPFTRYSVQVAAVNVRKSDGDNLEGKRSNETSVQTAEAAPSAPLSLSSTLETITWSPPKYPNGIIREYILIYQVEGKDSYNVTQQNTTLSAKLTGLDESIRYNISVCAVTISPGPCKSIIIIRNISTEEATDGATSNTGTTVVTTEANDGVGSSFVTTVATKEASSDADSKTDTTVATAEASDGADSNTVTTVAVAGVVILLIVAGIILAVIIVKRRRQKEKREAVTVEMSSMKHFKDEDPTSASLLVEVYEGSTALLSSNVTESYEIGWYRGEMCLPGKDTRFQQLSDGDLQITAVRSSDSGTYRRAASSDEQTVELIVKPVEVKEEELGKFEIDKTTSTESKTYAVPLDDFIDHVTAMNESKGSGFVEEFKELEKASAGMELTTNVAASNSSKNRYRNILTYDHARVILKAVPGTEPLKCDYIAAAYVDGHRIPEKYIASQGPTKSTAGDMWRMIWSENVRTIVMLTRLTEGNKMKCYQYWPFAAGETKNFEGFRINLDNVDEFAEYDIKSITIVLEQETRVVKLYHFTAWPDHGVPKFATGLLSFIKRVNRELPKDAGPIVVHCSAGVGRTGTFIVIDQMLERINEGLPIDVFRAVKSLRTRRQEMVQGEAQYAFIHVALLEAVLCGNTQIPVPSFRSAFSKLSKKDGKGRSGFERQYLVLQTDSTRVSKALCTAGLHPSVRKKNRYLDIVPLDDERVVLRPEEAGSGDNSTLYVNATPEADYINASYINGYRRQNAFIVTQGPLENTVDDFWQMVWEQDTTTIVNLTQLIEDGKEMCYQYWPKTKAHYGSYKVEIDSQSSSDSYVMRKLNVSKGSEMKTVCQFHFTAWSDEECPTSATHLLRMMAQIEKWQQTTGNNVITVHCNNGIGRSGVFCAIASVIEEMKMENVIDVFYKVKSLRIKRPGVVQSVDQYKFCYKAILDYTDGFDIYSNFK
ncbi:receptor-type tyrosine-protein phosphatase S-like isoform X2 [Oscarella lobularis]